MDDKRTKNNRTQGKRDVLGKWARVRDAIKEMEPLERS